MSTCLRKETPIARSQWMVLAKRRMEQRQSRLEQTRPKYDRTYQIKTDQHLQTKNFTVWLIEGTD